MKTTKRILATLLAVFMLAAMLTTGAFAAAPPSDGWIKIDGTVSNATYNLYKIFEIETVSSGEKTVYYYKPTPAWINFFDASSPGAFYGTVASSGYIVWKDQNLFAEGKDIQTTAIAAFANYALAYAKSLSPDVAATSETTSITISGLDTDAYYLVSSSLGATALAGPVSASGLTITEKNNANAAPTIVKTVGEGRAEMSVDVGAEYQYTVVVSLNEAVTAGELVFTDVVPREIEVQKNSLMITNTSQGSTTTLAEETDYMVTWGDENASGVAVLADETSYTHMVKFNGAFAAGDVLTFTYTAKLVSANGNLPVAHNMYTNLAKVQYGSVSVSDTATVFTLALEGYKYYMNDLGVQTDLPGAEFVLMNSNNKYYHFDSTTNTVSWVDSLSEATRKISNEADAEFEFYGIAAGTYYLVETVVPEGYAGAATTEVIIDRSTVEVEVENIKGADAILPSTGGIGTTIFYVVGAVLVLGAVTLLVTKKRANG